jgi:hypothetical protein
MQKKIAILGLSLFLILVLTGCAGKDVGKQNQQDNSVDQTQNQGSASQRKGLSAESVAACSGKNENDSCEMAMSLKNEEGKTMSGTCKKMTEEDQSACMPVGGPGGPGGQGNNSQVRGGQ